MKDNSQAVFHGLVNYGTQAGLLAKGLRECGRIAKSYTRFDSYNRQTDYQFRKPKFLIGKVFAYYIWFPLVKLSCFFRYDIFHFYFGTTLFYRQLDLPFYKLFGKKVVMHYLGYDVELYGWSKNNYAITNVTESFTDETGALHDVKILKRMNYEKKYINCSIVCAPQYSPFVHNSVFVPLGVDLQKFSPTPLPELTNSPFRIIHVPTSRRKKGTQYLIDAVEKLRSEGVNIELDICENVTHNDLVNRYKKAHVSVVALLGGWYGTAAIESMAMGRPVISFLRPEFFKYTSWKPGDVPIINANRDSIYEVLKETIQHTNQLHDLAEKSISFVHQFHDYRKVAMEVNRLYMEL